LIDLKSIAETVLHTLPASDVRVYVDGSADVLSDLELTRVIKIIAPANYSQIEARVSQELDGNPDLVWLGPRLDNLRKRGWLLRSAAANYSLTLKGLRASAGLPGKRSSDVERVLTLRNKVW
jgi:hypothetical protein